MRAGQSRRGGRHRPVSSRVALLSQPAVHGPDPRAEDQDGETHGQQSQVVFIAAAFLEVEAQRSRHETDSPNLENNQAERRPPGQ